MTLSRSFVRNAAMTPLDARLMLMELITQNFDGTPRTGVLEAGDAFSICGPTATMNLEVISADFVLSKGVADGVTMIRNDGTVLVPVTAAPPSNSRIDVLYVKHNDDTTGDASALPIFGVLAGVAAASPVKPGPLLTGALELGTLRIFSGTTATNGGANVFTTTYQMTALRGAPVPFRSTADRNLWTNPQPGQLARITDGATPQARWNGSAWRTLPGTVFGVRQAVAAQSVPTATITKLAVNTNSAFTGGATVGTNGIVVPVNGWYRVSGYCFWNANGTGTRVLTVRVNDADPTGYLLRDVAVAVTGGTPTSNGTVGIIHLNANDVISIWGTQTSGGSLDVTEKQLSVELLLAD